MSPVTTNLIQKAYLLAASGRFSSIGDIRNELHREGFSQFELTALNGRAMHKQPRKLIEGATAAAARGEGRDTPGHVPPTSEM